MDEFLTNFFAKATPADLTVGDIIKLANALGSWPTNHKQTLREVFYAWVPKPAEAAEAVKSPEEPAKGTSGPLKTDGLSSETVKKSSETVKKSSETVKKSSETDGMSSDTVKLP